MIDPLTQPWTEGEESSSSRDESSWAGYGTLVAAADGTILNMHPALTSALGYRVEELAGRSLECLFPLRDIWAEVRGMERWRGCVAVSRRNGGTESFQVTFVATNDEAGRLWRCVGVFERLGSEPAASASEARDWSGDPVAERYAIEARMRLFESLADASSDAIVIVQPEDGLLLYANRAAHRLFACDPERHEMLGQDGKTFWPAEDLPILAALMPIALAEGWTGDVRQRRRDGVVFDANATVYGLPLSDQRPPLLVAMIRDISERKRMETALKLTQFAVDRAADAVYLIDSDARFLYVNDAVSSALGLSRDELRSMSIEDIDPDARPEELALIFDELRRKRCLVFERCHRRKDGSVFPVEIRANYLSVDGKEYNCCFARDITEQKEAEKALRLSEARFRSVVSNAPVLIFELDDAGLFLLLEGRGLQALGLRPGELVGSAVAEFLEDEVPIPQYLAQALANEPVQFTARIGQRVFETFFNPVRDPRDGRVSVIGVAVDVTERTEREAELRQRTDELTRFTYTVSHDLKSPLVTIRTFLGFLEQDLTRGDAARIDKDIGFIRNAAERMTRLLDELLELSRIGRVVNAPTEFSLQELAGEVLDLVAGRIVERGVAVEVTATPVLIHGDRQRLAEVLLNLLDNAVKFMGDQARPLIQIEVGSREGAVEFIVRDNGQGIDPRHAHKIFDLFEKLDAGSDGTGIGLTLVQRIVEIHGGRIWVESEGFAKGAAFHFTLAGARVIAP